MGGRGAALFPGGGNQEWGDTNELLDKDDIVPDRGIEGLKKSIGVKKKPFSISNAITEANPSYNPHHPAYSFNCQRCVVAVELRRRGYDVTARPTYKGDTLPNHIKNNAYWQKAFQKGKRIKIGATKSMTVKKNLEAQMKKWGNGSRAVVGIPGHVFNVENVNGKIQYFDGQVNKYYTHRDVFENIHKGLTTATLMRTDNLRISTRVNELVKPRNKTKPNGWRTKK